MRNINDWLGKLFKNYMRGTSLSVQWLRLFASMAGALGSVLGWGTKILNASSCSQKKKKKKRKDVHETDISVALWNRRKFIGYFLKT